MGPPCNAEIQLDMLYDYRSNPPLYPQWQAYFRAHKPATLIVWGKNDEIFPPPGAWPYKRDLPNAEIHMIDTGHFALETHGVEDCLLHARISGTGGANPLGLEPGARRDEASSQLALPFEYPPWDPAPQRRCLHAPGMQGNSK